MLIAEVVHSETRQGLCLLAADTNSEGLQECPPIDELSTLKPERVCHYNNGRPYQLRMPVPYIHDGTHEWGVWYTVLYDPGADAPPATDYWRPVHTEDGDGWLDPVAGGRARFEPLYPR